MCLFQMEQERFSALVTENAALLKKQQDLERQLQHSVRMFIFDNFLHNAALPIIPISEYANHLWAAPALKVTRFLEYLGLEKTCKSLRQRGEIDNA